MTVGPDVKSLCERTVGSFPSSPSSFIYLLIALPGVSIRRDMSALLLKSGDGAAGRVGGKGSTKRELSIAPDAWIGAHGHGAPAVPRVPILPLCQGLRRQQKAAP